MASVNLFDVVDEMVEGIRGLTWCNRLQCRLSSLSQRGSGDIKDVVLAMMYNKGIYLEDKLIAQSQLTKIMQLLCDLFSCPVEIWVEGKQQFVVPKMPIAHIPPVQIKLKWILDENSYLNDLLGVRSYHILCICITLYSSNKPILQYDDLLLLFLFQHGTIQTEKITGLQQPDSLDLLQVST